MVAMVVVVVVLELICWRILCGFKDILRGKSNEVRFVAVKGQAVWSFCGCGMRYKRGMR